MRKVIVIACILMLLFAGCAVQESPETTGVAETMLETQPGIYVPESPVEMQSGGAVRQYALDSDAYTHISMMGERVVLIDNSENVMVKLYSGDRAVEVASVQLPGSADAIGFTTYHNGAAYYLESEHQVIFLDMQLKQADQVQLPEDILGKPVVSDDGAQIFFSSNQQISAIDVQRKITRLVKSHESKGLELLGSFMGGKVLACRAEYEDGSISVHYINTQTGQTMYSSGEDKELYTYEDRFFGRHIDGGIEQLFFGKGTEEISQINMLGGSFAPALELDSVIRYIQQEDGSQLLQQLELSTGRIVSEITLQDVGVPVSFAVNRWKNSVWILIKDGEENRTLLRWNVKASEKVDETVYTGKFYSAENPDEAGLKDCASRAKQIGNAHGIQLRLWKDAVKYPGNYSLEPEHQIDAIGQCLDQIESVLAEFPKKFVSKAISDQIRVCVVRNVNGEAKAVQYWNEGSAYIVIPVGCDIRNGFIKGLSYVIDSHVLGNSSSYDYWNSTNPEGFSYFDNATHAEKYISGNNRAFVDISSMTSVVEDRSAVFYEAMQADNQATFQSQAMQKKLRMLCEGIRSAWRLQNKAEVFPWEQYLDKPIYNG